MNWIFWIFGFHGSEFFLFWVWNGLGCAVGVGLVFVRVHNGDNGFGVVAGAAEGFEGC